MDEDDNDVLDAPPQNENNNIVTQPSQYEPSLAVGMARLVCNLSELFYKVMTYNTKLDIVARDKSDLRIRKDL